MALVAAAMCIAAASSFNFWNGLDHGGDWFWPLNVNANSSFMTRLTAAARPEANDAEWLRMVVDWAEHYAIQLHGNPEYLRSFDDAIRSWNPDANKYSGTIDSCGWPLDPKGHRPCRWSTLDGTRTQVARAQNSSS